MHTHIKRAGWGVSLAALLALSACGPNQTSEMSGEMPQDAYAFESDAMMESRAAPPAPAPMMEMEVVDEEVTTGGNSNGANEPLAQQIAYTYAFGFKVPTANLDALMKAHQAACTAAGPTVCYVENSNISGLGEDYASGYQQVRATPEWVEKFRSGLEADMEPFGAQLDSSNQSAENLTARIIDTTATLNSRKTLRDRLQKLLADRPGKLSDLLEIERELARVQQQIDSTESILAAMRLRVAMSSVSLNYAPKYSPASESIWRPLGNAISDFLGNVVRSFAGLINLISELLIPILLLGGVLWGALAFWRRGKKQTPKPPPAA